MAVTTLSLESPASLSFLGTDFTTAFVVDKLGALLKPNVLSDIVASPLPNASRSIVPLLASPSPPSTPTPTSTSPSTMPISLPSTNSWPGSTETAIQLGEGGIWDVMRVVVVLCGRGNG